MTDAWGRLVKRLLCYHPWTAFPQACGDPLQPAPLRAEPPLGWDLPLGCGARKELTEVSLQQCAASSVPMPSSACLKACAEFLWNVAGLREETLHREKEQSCTKVPRAGWVCGSNGARARARPRSGSARLSAPSGFLTFSKPQFPYLYDEDFGRIMKSRQSSIGNLVRVK